MNQKTSKVEKEFYLRCSYLTLSVLFDKEPKRQEQDNNPSCSCWFTNFFALY